MILKKTTYSTVCKKHLYFKIVLNYLVASITDF